MPNLSSPTLASDRLYADMLSFVQSAEPNQRLASTRALGRKYGVSHATVSNVLDQLVEKELLYKVHGRGCFVAAPTTNSSSENRKTVIYGVVWGAVSHSYYSQIWHGVAEEVASAGYRLLVLPLGVNGQHNDTVILDEVKRNQSHLAGIILPWITPDIEAGIVAACPRLPILISQSTEPGQQLCSVLRDTYTLGYMAAEYLIKSGCKRLAIVFRGKDFQHGVRDAVEAAGRTVELEEIHFVRPHQGSDIATALQQANPDAVAFSEDRVALAALHAIAPIQPDFLERVRVISHANLCDDILPPQVARLEYDGHRRGIVTAQTLLGLIEERLPHNMDIRLKPTFVSPLTPTSHTAKEEPQSVASVTP